MKCEEIQTMLMELPVGEYAPEISDHLTRCPGCEKVYMDLRRLENVFRTEGLIQRPNSNPWIWVSATAGLAMIFILLFPVQTKWDPLEPSLEHTQSASLINEIDTRIYAGWDGVHSAVDSDPWSDFEMSLDEDWNSLLEGSAQAAYDEVHNSVLQSGLSEMERDDPWEEIEIMEG